MRPILLAAAAALAIAPLPALGQTVPGSGVAASERANSPERPIEFAERAPDGAALVVMMASAALPAGLPLSEAETKALAAAIGAAKFTGKANEVLSLRGIGSAPRIVLVGTGPAPTALARMEAAGKAAQELRSEDASLALLGAGDGAAMADAALGFALGQYRFDRYRSTGKPPPASAVSLIGAEVAAARTSFAARHAGIAEGVRLARDLANEPASTVYPESFVARSRAAFAGIPGITIEVLDEPAMRRLKMGSIVGVGQGSPRGSRLLLLTYKGAEGAPLALVGKGITFDSGGISLKPAAGMGSMKADMSGAAAVTGAVLALARGKAPVHVVAVAALAENMPDGNAQRPGDVVRTMSGKTIEVVNTDSEGRLVLADALEYVASTRKPAAIVDIATLTGSVIGALGDDYAGLFARDEKLAAAVQAAGEASGEHVWRLPLHPSYAEDIRSDVADVKNSGGSGPGAGLGAEFVGHFVDPATPWAHVDMAGMMEATKPAPLTPKGMTGYGVRLLESLARNWKP